MFSAAGEGRNLVHGVGFLAFEDNSDRLRQARDKGASLTAM